MLTLPDLAHAVGLVVVAPAPAEGAGRAPSGQDVRVLGVTLDSRRVRPGDLYAALPGAHTHGARFAGAAVAAGAVAVLTDEPGAHLLAQAGVPLLLADDPRLVLGRVCALVYGEPARDLTLLAVTGTNGKTTVTTLLEQAMAATGVRTGLVGTICTRVAGEVLPSARTTPEAPDLHALLALMRERGVTACALEVSSHAVVLHRVDGVVFDVVAFTNLSRDHLDFHATMEEYFAAKAELFTPARARRAVVCVDDAWGAELARRSRAGGLPTTTVSTTGAAADWRVEPSSVGPRDDGREGDAFVLVGPDASGDAQALATSPPAPLPMASPLPGAFNVANTALALVVLALAGVDPAAAARALAAVPGVPGRMEVVAPRTEGRSTQLPRGLVDYAHTPDAVAAALAALRPSTPGTLAVVLGAGGDRDRDKRPAMGAAAARGADVVVVTDDNPRSEDAAAIRAAVLAGARSAAGPAVEVVEVAGRAAAVVAAVAAVAAVEGSTVLVAGKGHEQGQEVAGVVHPFDDRAVLAAALAELVQAPAPRTDAPGRGAQHAAGVVR